ncbi:MAG: hypothetical protein COA96_10395 [SAR86 cluster bacterium]|uniref:Uncharacterized protein n=1 Tax=SAR86 cluster bacterium TaxID=2030880 RepID=A0A2A5AZ67_9GAMM|nr:MAG: hypothetical protein COA96_10395 [SAR86 cluster bacterium]
MAQAETALLEDKDDLTEELETEELGAKLLDEDENDQNEGDENDEDHDEGDEIVLDGDDGSHPQDDEQRGIRKRINKLNAKVVKAETGQEQSAADLEVANERNRLLQLALDTQNAPVDGPPNPDDFDDGVTDAGYISAFQNHIANGVKADMLQAQQTTQTQTEAASNLEERQFAHYKKADTLKVKDYDDTENKAIAILGQEITNQVISASDKSPELLYYLGKNPEKAKEISALIKSDPVKGVLQIGRLEARLVARPKAKTNHAPSPDSELSGGGSGRPKGKRGPTGATFE